jgi:aspartate aminotransferase
MTGWRIGYAGGPKKLITAMTDIQSHSTSNPTSISQAAAVAALNGDQQCVRDMCAAFKTRHDKLLARLQQLPGVTCLPSDGTFYSFPDFSQAIARLGLADDLAFAEFLINEAGVALVPGSAFGSPGHVRISFATSQANLDQALDRIAAVLPA